MGAILNSPFIAPCTVAEEQILLRRFFPFAELLYLIAVQDGAIDEREVEVAFGALHALTHGRISFSVYQDLARELRRRLNRDGLDARLDAICAQLSLDPADAELAFTLAVAMSWADESLSEDEGALLAELGSWLGLSARAQAQVLKGSRRSKPPSLPSSAT